ncbi:MAG: hypothetical protein H0Z28_07530 [Archaeoglobus sp.]|nr:hypothetical protein [Archaeoglobus sp.]
MNTPLAHRINPTQAHLRPQRVAVLIFLPQRGTPPFIYGLRLNPGTCRFCGS